MVDKLSIIRGKYEFPVGSPISEEAKDFISLMLQFYPEDRISINDALYHPWFNDILDKEPKIVNSKRNSSSSCYMPELTMNA
ncbi:hypothetical protein TRFO_40332 [Tritrichomonas foetus]|uniref:Protein kinase domain-containing protein n=1 Tax=Tritrichomonas foetus TaxID=1144522 RepID=A0A1J4J1W4_9EUKA|nr:hypothetical protein TRFO_40332 [Tritrichomonas foetus]|eukprot:OHS93370.1 hypothetical protein TRFO_40332 [Tritrichomonas foetus]